MARPKRVVTAEVVEPEKPIKAPADGKKVRVTRVEEFTEASAPPGPVVEVGDDDDDAIEAEIELEDAEPEELSPLQQFLQNLTGTSDAVVYVIRKPDSPTSKLKFKNPCTMRMTVGEIPFDDAFTDKESIDLAVQSAFDGGNYQLQIRQNGQVLKSWSTVIPDPPDVRAAEPAPPAQTPPAPAPMESELAELERTAQRLKRLRDMMGWDGAAAAPAQLPPAPSIESQLLDLAKSDDGLKAKIIDKYFGSEDEGKTSIVGDVLKHPQEAIQLLHQGAMVVATLLGRAPQPPNGQTQQQPPQEPTDPLLPLLEPYRPVIEYLAVELINDTETADVMQALEAFKENDPTLGPALLMIADMGSVDVLMKLAAFTRNPIILKLKNGPAWVEDLQAAIKGEAEGGEQEEENNGDEEGST